MALTKSEIETQLKRSGERRYDYFVKTAVATELVFSLTDEEGWALLSEDQEAEDIDVFAVFPHPEFAELFRDAAGMSENRVEALDLFEFLEWLEDFAEKNMKVAVFPNLEFQGAVIDPARLRDDLQALLEREMGEEEE